MDSKRIHENASDRNVSQEHGKLWQKVRRRRPANKIRFAVNGASTTSTSTAAAVADSIPNVRLCEAESSSPLPVDGSVSVPTSFNSDEGFTNAATTAELSKSLSVLCDEDRESVGTLVVGQSVGAPVDDDDDEDGDSEVSLGDEDDDDYDANASHSASATPSPATFALAMNLPAAHAIAAANRPAPSDHQAGEVQRRFIKDVTRDSKASSTPLCGQTMINEVLQTRVVLVHFHRLNLRTGVYQPNPRAHDLAQPLGPQAALEPATTHCAKRMCEFDGDCPSMKLIFCVKDHTSGIFVAEPQVHPYVSCADVYRAVRDAVARFDTKPWVYRENGVPVSNVVPPSELNWGSWYFGGIEQVVKGRNLWRVVLRDQEGDVVE